MFKTVAASPAAYALQIWWGADGIEPLAFKEDVYSVPTAPACPYCTPQTLVPVVGYAPTHLVLQTSASTKLASPAFNYGG